MVAHDGPDRTGLLLGVGGGREGEGRTRARKIWVSGYSSLMRNGLTDIIPMRRPAFWLRLTARDIVGSHTPAPPMYTM